jgi:hypothetical protein
MRSGKLRNFTAAFAIVCGILFVYGFIAESATDRITLKAMTEPRLLTVVVMLHDIDEDYRWLSVYGCSADMTETGTHCTGNFERESTIELFGGWKHHFISWRDVPKGTMQITAMAFDANQKQLAVGQLVVFR